MKYQQKSFQVPPKLSQEKESEIAQMFNLPGKICLDKRLHITQLSSEEIKKHNYFTSANVENREDVSFVLLRLQMCSKRFYFFFIFAVLGEDPRRSDIR